MKEGACTFLTTVPTFITNQGRSRDKEREREQWVLIGEDSDDRSSTSARRDKGSGRVNTIRLLLPDSPAPCHLQQWKGEAAEGRGGEEEDLNGLAKG